MFKSVETKPRARIFDNTHTPDRPVVRKFVLAQGEADDLTANYDFVRGLDENGLSLPVANPFSAAPAVQQPLALKKPIPFRPRRAENQLFFEAEEPLRVAPHMPPTPQSRKIPHKAINAAAPKQKVISVDLRKLVSEKAARPAALPAQRGPPQNAKRVSSAQEASQAFNPFAVSASQKAKSQLEALKREMEESLRVSSNSFKLNMKHLMA